MEYLDYPPISVGAKSNEENIQVTKAFLNNLVDQYNYAISSLQDRIATLETSESSSSSDGDTIAGAAKIHYDNSSSSLSSNTVQGAIGEINNNLAKVASHIGMIIQSTTLDTMEKVIAIYGGTTWTRLDDMFLVGAGKSYEVNSTGGKATVTPAGTNSGGAVANHTLTTSEVPAHTHTRGTMNITGSTKYISSNAVWSNTASGAFSGYAGDSSVQITNVATSGKAAGYYFNFDASRNWTGATSSVGGDGAHNHSFTQPTFTGTSHTNLPPYKAVYIWERTE